MNAWLADAYPALLTQNFVPESQAIRQAISDNEPIDEYIKGTKVGDMIDALFDEVSLRVGGLQVA